jgi:hypothetical protein
LRKSKARAKVERTYDDAQDHTIRLPARLGGLST